jgi:[NiFe] hydrogenase diaphorase moiety small subunit
MSASRFILDGKPVPFRPGQTIMEAAAEAGVYIPHLCYQPGYSPHGSCKLCTVVVDGQPMSACTTKARDGIAVENDTPALNADRRALTEMLFVEGNHICPACEQTGNCQLQAVAYHLELATYRFEHFYPPRSLDASHPDIVLDRNRCILCDLCVRASREIDRKNVFEIGGRGIASHLGAPRRHRPLGRRCRRPRLPGGRDPDQAACLRGADRPAHLRPEADQRGRAGSRRGATRGPA